MAKKDFKSKLRFTGKLYSDLPLKASTKPYFSVPEAPMEPEEEELGLEVIETHLSLTILSRPPTHS